MAEIMGRPAPKVEAKEEPAPKVEAAPPKVEPPVEVAPPAVEKPAAVEEMPAWMMGEGEPPSPEEALAWLSKISAGKEAELQAQAEVEAEARMAEIMGRPAPKVEAAPPKVEPKVDKLAPKVEAAPPKVEPKVEKPAPPKVEPKVEKPVPKVEAAPPKVEPKVDKLAPKVEAAPPKVELPIEPEIPPLEAEAGFTLPPWAEPFEGVSVPELAVEPAPEWPAFEPVMEQSALGELALVEPGYAGPEPTGVQPGPAWWCQVAADEEEIVPEEAPPVEAPEPEQAPPPPPRRAPKPPRPKVTARPSGPVFDLDGLMTRLRANPNDHAALLGLARGWMQQDNLASAGEAYGELVKAGHLLDDVIDDLETAVDSHSSSAALWQLLGDAYMKAGHLQKALKTYRQALKKI